MITDMIPDQLLRDYGFETDQTVVSPFGTGLINHTWRVTAGNGMFILQRINTDVFKDPDGIAQNLRSLDQYLKQHAPGYLFVAPVADSNGQTLWKDHTGCYRIFPFVKGSHAVTVVQTADQAFGAAKQFGRFTKVLSGFDARQLSITLPWFHDLGYRFAQFQEAITRGDAGRIDASGEAIRFLQDQDRIVHRYQAMQNDPAFRIRVTHHDTKISNVLFNEKNQAVCVVDLDTVMPGYFISDIGDMMRTYLPAVSEEEKDLSKVDIREDIYHAIVDGYLSEMKDELSEAEQSSFFYAAEFLIYMQALRFLTDHLLNDRYYGASYEGHNLVRAMNQITLLQRLQEKKHILTH
jgi:Ser/Thr protein kinase RdoA (MazF antagonist)